MFHSKFAFISLLCAFSFPVPALAQVEIPATAQATLIVLNDLPGGFSFLKVQSLTNRDAASQQAYSTEIAADEWLRKYEADGRIGSRYVSFFRPFSDAGDLLTTGADVFKTPQGAATSFSFERKVFYESRKAINRAYKAMNVDLEQIDLKQGPDELVESIIIQLRGIETVDNKRIPTIGFTLAWRDRDLIHSLQWLSGRTAPFETDIVELAQIQQKRSASR